MNCIIFYKSVHHGNTKKLLEKFSEKESVSLYDISVNNECTLDLNQFDVMGFASGIAFGKYYPQVLEFMRKNLPEGRKVFFVHTAGNPKEKYSIEARKTAEGKGCTCLGTFCCKGFDTFGIFKMFGGIAKGHPNEKDIENLLDFYNRRIKQ